MSGRPTDSDAVAEVLRTHPPDLDELQRARMERAILARDGAAPRANRPRPIGAVVLGAAIAAAAAVALFFALRSPSPDAPVARFELRDVEATAQRGTLEAGSVLSTGPSEVADVRVADSEVRVEPSSRVRIATLTPDRLALELSEGEVRVGFHPRRRGHEQLVVTTAQARVEVVGTVFTVRARGGATRVSVSEGVVRVVPLRGGAVREVRAGESTEVGVPIAVADVEDEEGTQRSGAAEVVSASDPSPQPPPASGRGSVTPRAVLEAARRHIEAGRADRAEPLLRRLAAGSAPVAIRVEAWALLGDLAQRSGRLEQAVTSYERAATLGRGTMAGTNAIYALARLQERRIGDDEAARRGYARYLDASPRGPLADQARAALCRLGDDERCRD